MNDLEVPAIGDSPFEKLRIVPMMEPTQLLKQALSPPLRTAALPGTGGMIKSKPEDFRVNEMLLYPPTGSGDHLFVSVEKYDLSHRDLVHRIQNALEISERDIGWAGIKDKMAITRQTLSLPAACEDRLAGLEAPDLRILSTDRHEQKIRKGHHAGNQFTITIREVADDGLDRAQAILEALGSVGIANYYGQQRFSTDGHNIESGLHLLGLLAQGKRINRRFVNQLRLQAVQSALFNMVVAHRLETEILDCAIEGDLLKKRDTGGLFISEDIAEETERIRAGTLAPTGPIFGKKMWAPEGKAHALEEAVVASAGVDIASFQAAGKMMKGTRRPVTVLPDDLEIRAGETTSELVLQFVLPKGSYATVLLQEIQKNEPSAAS